MTNNIQEQLHTKNVQNYYSEKLWSKKNNANTHCNLLFALEKRNYLNSIYKKAKFFLLKLLLLRSWGLANNLHIYKKIWKT